MKRTNQSRWVGIAIIAVLVVAVILLWPPHDPLADVDTVAVRVGDAPPQGARVDYLGELRVALRGRNLRIVSDETAADVVLSLSEFRLDLGDIEISLTDGNLRGQARAVCIVTDVQTGKVHTMDFVIRFASGSIRAEIIPRRFWQFW